MSLHINDLSVSSVVQFRSVSEPQLFADDLSNPIHSILRAIDTDFKMSNYHTKTTVLILQVLNQVIDGDVVSIGYTSFLKRTLERMELDTDVTLQWKFGLLELLKEQRRHARHLLGLKNDRRVRNRIYPFLHAWVKTAKSDAENK